MKHKGQKEDAVEERQAGSSTNQQRRSSFIDLAHGDARWECLNHSPTGITTLQQLNLNKHLIFILFTT